MATVPHIIIQDLETGRREDLGRGDEPVYSPSGHIVYEDAAADGSPGSDLWALPFSLDTLTVTGEAFRIAQQGGSPSVSSDQTLVYRDKFRDFRNRVKRQLVWRDRGGQKMETVSLPAAPVVSLALSPDGLRAAVSTWEGTDLDVSVYDLVRGGARTRLSNPQIDRYPQWSRLVWSPGGDQVAFTLHTGSSLDIVARQAESGRVPSVRSRPPASPSYSRSRRA
jgi:hypothetical protein